MATYYNVTSNVTHFMEFTEECLTVFWTYVHALVCVTSNVTHFMEFTEECLTVFWTYVHTLVCVYFWLLGTWAKLTRSR